MLVENINKYSYIYSLRDSIMIFLALNFFWDFLSIQSFLFPEMSHQAFFHHISPFYLWSSFSPFPSSLYFIGILNNISIISLFHRCLSLITHISWTHYSNILFLFIKFFNQLKFDIKCLQNKNNINRLARELSK